MNSMLCNKKEEIVLKTRDACVKLLNNHKKAFLIRSTGFGKTWIMSDLIDSGRWKKVIYIYPLDSIKKDFVNKYSEKFNGVDVRCISYTSLAMVNRLPFTGRVEDILPDLKGMEEGLFIFDEAHRVALVGPNKVGVNSSSEFVKRILADFPNAYYFGATATPYRTDRGNMVDTIFDGRLVFPYNINDAIRDGFYCKPRYVFSTYDIKTLGDSLHRNLDEQTVLSDEQVFEERNKLNGTIIKYSKLLNMPSIIKRNINAINCRKDYMKFIVFFSNKETLFSKYKDVIAWFKSAFPSMTIRDTIVVSGNNEYKGNFEKVVSLEDTSGVIDLVFNINMIGMGYHDNNITGVMMIRLTSSDIIYTQAIGRCFSMEKADESIIFDIVGNYTISEDGEISSKKLLGSNKDKNQYSEYTGYINESIVNMSDDIKEIQELLRLTNYARIQHEEELVRMYLKGIFDKEICANELNIDVESFERVLERHSIK